MFLKKEKKRRTSSENLIKLKCNLQIHKKPCFTCCFITLTSLVWPFFVTDTISKVFSWLWCNTANIKIRAWTVLMFAISAWGIDSLLKLWSYCHVGALGWGLLVYEFCMTEIEDSGLYKITCCVSKSRIHWHWISNHVISLGNLVLFQINSSSDCFWNNLFCCC